MDKLKPHILILPRWYPNKDDIQLGVFIKEQAKLLANTYNISIVYVHLVKNASQKYTIETNSTHNIKEVIVYFKTASFFKKSIHFLRYKKAQKLGLKQLQQSVDLCHIHVPIRPVFLALKLRKTNQVPFIITEHWSGHLTGEFEHKHRLYKTIYKSILKKASAVTTVSASLQKKFKTNTGYQSQIIPNYIQSVQSDSTKKIHSNQIQLLSISDLNEATKNISGLLEGFAKAIKKIPNLCLTIIGDGPDLSIIQSKIKALKLEESVHLRGRLSHELVLKQIPNYDFYICNSNVETFGMTVSEALMAGKPVISTQCGGPEEFVNKDNGLLIPIQNSDALSKAIIVLANNYQQYAAIEISNAIKLKYGKKVVHAQWQSLYDSILP